MKKDPRVSRRWRTATVLALGIVVGTMLVAQPAGAHFLPSIAHIWSHIRPKADVRYVNESQIRCPAGTVRSQGMCFETTNRTATDPYSASVACANAGRFLPAALWLRAARNVTGIDLDAAGEWSSNEWFDDTNQWQLFAVHEDGFVEPTADTQSRKYRCTTFPIPSRAFQTVPDFRPASRPASGGGGG